MMKFGHKLKSLMEAKGIRTQKQLSVLCGWTEGNTSSRFSQYLSCKRYPLADDAKKIAHALGVTIEELILETDYPHYIIIEKNQKTAEVPVVKWHQITNVIRDFSLLKQQPTLDFTFRKEKDLFASEIPNTIIPGQSSDVFKIGTTVLISPHRDPVNSQYIVVTEAGWLEPIFAEYYVIGDAKCVRLPWETTPKRFPENLKKCGVVVAWFKIEIQHSLNNIM